MCNKTKLLSTLALGGLISILSIDPAYATATGNGALFDSGTNFLNALEALLTGTWARIIAIIAVVFLGFAWMSGRISWPIAASTIGGIILVFGSAAIVDSINASI
ncbi:MAG: TrbC/VirB2 family protein [Alphaproteobacteria bacterium]|nr:TrbC/VirB2 family protein [Alphaproteobacteria bacterium]